VRTLSYGGKKDNYNVLMDHIITNHQEEYDKLMGIYDVDDIDRDFDE